MNKVLKKTITFVLILGIITMNSNITVLANEIDNNQILQGIEESVETPDEEMLEEVPKEATGEEIEKEQEEVEKTEKAEEAEVEEETPRIMGYIEDDIVVPSLGETQEDNTVLEDKSVMRNFAAAYSQDIPTSYSAKDRLPAIRDQGAFGVCWSFAALSAGEASLISKGMADKNIDLSEFQLAYFFYHSIVDPLGNTEGDKNELLQGDYLNIGGNNVFTTFALANWVGATDEQKAPYNTASVSATLPSSLSYEDDYHMQNAYWINMKSDADEVKKMIIKYGAVASAFYTDQTTTVGDTASYNDATASYYYGGSYKTNHAVTLVGWNDNYSNTNFKAENKPVQSGAWLVRNSWGKAMGEEGYFWISYEDSAFQNENSKAFVFDFESGDNYDHNYQYDGASGNSSSTLKSEGSIANIFTASGNKEQKKEEIQAVSFALYDVNVNYSIQIYTNLIDEADPTSGEKAYESGQTGTTSYVGYYTIPLNKTVTIDPGEKFSVVITLSKDNMQDTKFFVDYSYTNGSWIKFTNATKAGQSFQKNGLNSPWVDLNKNGATARIKAFTKDIVSEDDSVEVASVTLNKASAALTTGENMVLSAEVLPSNATNKNITWTSTNSGIASVDQNGTVTAIGKGTGDIIAETSNGLKAVCQVAVEEPIQETVEEVPSDIIKDVGNQEIEATNITLNRTALNMKALESLSLEATITPENTTNKSITWTTSNNEVAEVSQDGVVKATGIGSAVITATASNHVQVSIPVTVAIGRTDSLTANSQSTSSISLGWQKQYGVTGYEVYRYDSVKKKYVKIATNKKASKVTYTDKKKKSGTTYKYKVRAYKTKNGKKSYGGYSTVFTTTTKTTKPNLNITSASKKAKLKWEKVSGASGYEVMMSTEKKGDYTKVKTITKGGKTTYTKKKLKKKQTYYFKVRAYKTVEGVTIYSSYSKVKAVKIK